MPRLRRTVMLTALLLVIAVLAASSYSLWTVRRSLPTVRGTLTVEGLESGVTVMRDQQGVPQIYADNPHDLFFAQGYVQAQDRFWQMDVHRHATQGRLAEMFGADLVSRDAVVRTLGWERVAYRELQKLAPSTRRYLRAYADGVNAYLKRRNGAALSAEYAILNLRSLDDGYEPPQWTPVDSLTWLKAMAWTLRSNMGQEIQRALLAGKLPVRRIEQLYPPYPYERHGPIVSESYPAEGNRGSSTNSHGTFPEAARAEFANVAALVEAGPEPLGKAGAGVGSNSWVVSGSRTETGEPMLANDPHLGATLPSIWYQMGLHCRSVTPTCPFDVTGFSFPGLPGVVIGHNADIAWGFTNLGADVTDLFLERVREDEYLFEGQWRPLRTRKETIQVAGSEPVTITVRATRHGPLLSDVQKQLRDVGARAPVPDAAKPVPAREHDGNTPRAGSPVGYAVALRWTALDPGRTADAIFALDTATDWESFRAAAELFAVPSQNLVYADTRGNIGYQAPGRIPIRAHGDGRWPVPGWTDRYEWKGFIDFDQLPYALNPQQGYIVTANNAVIGQKYPYLLTEDWSYGYRSRQITRRIEDAGKLSIRDMSRIQQTTYNPNAAEIVPYLLRAGASGSVGTAGTALSLLRDWNYRQPGHSSGDTGAAAAYFNSVWRHLLSLTFHDEMPRPTWPTGGDRWFEVVRDLLDKPGSAWWDDTGTRRVERRDDILRRAVSDAYRELTGRYGDNPDHWNWGEMHALTLTHQSLGTSGIGVVEAMFNRGPVPVGGGDAIVNATGWDAAAGYETDTVPSMRMIVSLANLDASRWINLTGASGHVVSAHYSDQVELWRRGQTTPFPFTRRAVERAAEHTLLLRPH